MGRMGSCFVMTLVRYKVGWFFFPFFGLFLYLHVFQNENIYYNKNMLSKPLKVIIYIRIASKSAFERLAHKDAACKTEVFCIHYFWRTKRKWTKKFTEWCFSCQNKSVCQKLPQSCKKWKSAQNPIYALLAWRPLIVKFVNFITVYNRPHFSKFPDYSLTFHSNIKFPGPKYKVSDTASSSSQPWHWMLLKPVYKQSCNSILKLYNFYDKLYELYTMYTHTKGRSRSGIVWLAKAAWNGRLRRNGNGAGWG